MFPGGTPSDVEHIVSVINVVTGQDPLRSFSVEVSDGQPSRDLNS
jgi:hypothetical protein